MNKKIEILKLTLILCALLTIKLSNAQPPEIFNPRYIKGCGENGGGLVSRLGLRLSVKCPGCCQGLVFGTLNTGHRCNIDSTACGISSPEHVPGPCPACVEVVEGIDPNMNQPGWKITVYAVNRFWWVINLTEDLHPYWGAIVEGDIIGEPDGYEIAS